MPNHLFSGVLTLLALQLSAMAAEVVAPRCQTTCGNVSSPYPFCFSTGCFLPGFNLSCNNPTRLLMGDGASGVFHHNATTRIIRSASRSVISMRNNVKPGTWGLSGNRSEPFCRRRPPSNMSTVPVLVARAYFGTVQDDMDSPFSGGETCWCSRGYYGEPYLHGCQGTNQSITVYSVCQWHYSVLFLIVW